MKDILSVLEQFRWRMNVSQIPRGNSQSGIITAVAKILEAAGHQIIDDSHVKFSLTKQVNHMAANEAGSAGHNGNGRRGLHRRPALRTVFTLKYCSSSKLF